MSDIHCNVDTREQKNQHVLEKCSFQVKDHENCGLLAMIPKNPELGITRDIYLAAGIERKNGVDELF